MKYRYYILLILCSFISVSITQAAIATKEYACEQADGSYDDILTLKIGKTKATAEYYTKFEGSVYAVVPQLLRKRADGSQYYHSLALYQYDCHEKKAHRLSGNLKSKIKSIYSPVYGDDTPSAYKDEISFGEIVEIKEGVISLYLGIPQTGISSNIIHIPH